MARRAAEELGPKLRARQDFRGARPYGPVVPPPSPDSELRLTRCDKQPLGPDLQLPILQGLKTQGFDLALFKQITFERNSSAFELVTDNTPEGLAAKLNLLEQQRIENPAHSNTQGLAASVLYPWPSCTRRADCADQRRAHALSERGVLQCTPHLLWLRPKHFLCPCRGGGAAQRPAPAPLPWPGERRHQHRLRQDPPGDHQLTKLPNFLSLEGTLCRPQRYFKEPVLVTTTPNPRRPRGGPSLARGPSPGHPLTLLTRCAGSPVQLREPATGLQPPQESAEPQGPASGSATDADPKRLLQEEPSAPPIAAEVAAPSTAQQQQEPAPEPLEAEAEEAPFQIPKSHQKTAAKRAARQQTGSLSSTASPAEQQEEPTSPKHRQQPAASKPASKAPCGESLAKAKQPQQGRTGPGARGSSRTTASAQQPTEPKKPLNPSGRPRRENAGKGGWQTHTQFGGPAVDAAASSEQA